MHVDCMISTREQGLGVVLGGFKCGLHNVPILWPQSFQRYLLSINFLNGACKSLPTRRERDLVSKRTEKMLQPEHLCFAPSGDVVYFHKYSTSSYLRTSQLIRTHYHANPGESDNPNLDFSKRILSGVACYVLGVFLIIRGICHKPRRYVYNSSIPIVVIAIFLNKLSAHC